jgi:glycosyltransferase involved in cell wall biosynthesis
MEWGVRDDEKLVGVVARLDPMKDHATFLKAAGIVAASHERVKFACVGDGSDACRRELVRLAHEWGIADRIIWASARHDVWRVYNALDLAVSASRFGEGFPNAVAEAMATGVPCVVTDVGDSAAIVADTGWICAPRDSRAIADAIGAALSRLPVEPLRVRERIQANYASPQLLRRTARQLSSLLESGAVATGR